VFAAKAELSPEKECPRKLTFELDTVNVAVSRDKTIFIGGMQYTPQKEGDITNGMIDCRNDFQYTVAYNGTSTLRVWIRFNETTRTSGLCPIHERRWAHTSCK